MHDRLIRAVAVPGHDSRCRLQHGIERRIVVPGAGLHSRPTADLGGDNGGIDRGKLIVRDAERPGGPVEKVVQDDVRAFDQPGQRGLAGIGLEVENDGALALVDVDAEPHGRVRPGLGRRRIDADDVRAVFGKGAAGGRAGHDVREIEHPDSVKHPSRRKFCVRIRPRARWVRPFHRRRPPREIVRGGRRRPKPRRADRRVLDGQEPSRLAHRAAGRVFDVGGDPGLPYRRVGQPFGARPHHACRHVGRTHRRFPFQGRAGLHRLGDKSDKPRAPGRSQARRLVHVVAGIVLRVGRLAHHPLGNDPVVDAEGLEKGAVLIDVIGGADEEDPAVRAFVKVDRRVGVAPHEFRDLGDMVFGHLAAQVAECGKHEIQHRVVDGREVVARGLALDLAGKQGHGGHHAIGERHFDVLAAAGALAPVEPERRGEAAEYAAIGRCHGNGRIDRRAEQGAEGADIGIDADGSVDRSFPGRNVAHRIALGEAGQGDVDEAASVTAEPGVVEPQCSGGAGAHVLDYDVRLGGPAAAGAPRRLVLEVELDQALAAVQQGIDGVGRAAGPHDLDHVRPLVGQQHRSHPAGPARAEIENANPRQRRRALRCIGRHLCLPPAKPARPAAESVLGGSRIVSNRCRGGFETGFISLTMQRRIFLRQPGMPAITANAARSPMPENQHCRPGFNPGPSAVRRSRAGRLWTPDFRFAPSGVTLRGNLRRRLSERQQAANAWSQI